MEIQIWFLFATCFVLYSSAAVINSEEENRKLDSELSLIRPIRNQIAFLKKKVVEVKKEIQAAKAEVDAERNKAKAEVDAERNKAKAEVDAERNKAIKLEIDENSSSIILRQIMILLAVRNKATIIENRLLDIKGIIPDGKKRLDFDVPGVMQRKYKWFEMLNQCRSTDMYVQKLNEHLYKKYQPRIEDFQNTLVIENCDKLERDLNERLKEIRVLNDLIKKKQEGFNESTMPNNLKEMEDQLEVKKRDYKELEKNLKDKCTKVKDAIEHLTYNEFKLNFCHSLAYSVESTNKIITHIEIMGLKSIVTLKIFDGVVDEYVSIFYNAVC